MKFLKGLFSLSILYASSITTLMGGLKNLNPHVLTDSIHRYVIWPDSNRLKKCTRVQIETNIGSMVFALYNETPKHRENFLKLIKNNFYRDILFHRVIKNFVIQCGDPASRGAKKNKLLGAGEAHDPNGIIMKVDSEIIDTFYHLKGALAAARQGNQINPLKKSSSSQIYIVAGKPVTKEELEKSRNELSEIRFFDDTSNYIYRKRKEMYMQSFDFIALTKMRDDLVPFIRQYRDSLNINYPEWVQHAYETIGGTPMLDGEYTVFGQMITGFDVLDQIAETPTNLNDRPLRDIKIIRCSVIQ